MRHLFGIAVFGLILAPLAHANPPGHLDNWHHWRGPSGDGRAAPQAEPPLHWDAKTNVKWRAPLQGRGSATPIVWGKKVFVVTAIPTDKVVAPEDLPKPDPKFTTKTKAPNQYWRFLVLCFDRDTGKMLWEREAAQRVPHEGHHFSHSYAAGSPTTDGKFLYVSFGSFGIYCYDFDGALQWSRDLGRMRTRLGWGEAVTPVVHGSALLLNWDQEANSALYCLDAASGKTTWKAEREEKTSWNTPLVVEHKGTTQVIVNGTNKVRAYDLESGKELWQVGGMTVNAIPSPVAADGVAYIMSGYGAGAAVAVSLDARGPVVDDKVSWRHTKGTPYVPSPLLAAGRLYFTQANKNLWTVLEARSGKVVVDRERLPRVGDFYGSPIAVAGRIYLTDRDGTTLVLKQSDSIEVLATNPLPDKIDASPVAVGRQLFLRGEEFLWCLEGK